MKNILTNLMTSAVLLCSIGGGLEAQTVRLQAKIPFAWQVNNQRHNAGECTIARDAVSKVVRIDCSADRTGVYLSAAPASNQSSVARMVFHRIGNQYFLTSVFAPGMTVGNLPVSAAEKEAIASEQTREIATVFVDIKPIVD